MFGIVNILHVSHLGYVLILYHGLHLKRKSLKGLWNIQHNPWVLLLVSKMGLMDYRVTVLFEAQAHCWISLEIQESLDAKVR